MHIIRKLLLLLALFSGVILAIWLYSTISYHPPKTTTPFPPTPSAQEPSATPTSFPKTTSEHVSASLTQGQALGTLPHITGAMGWTLGGVKGHQVFFTKAKELGITTIRLMHVLDRNNDWTVLDNALSFFAANGQQVILCIGDLKSPPQSNDEIKQEAQKLDDLLEHMVTTYGIQKTNAIPIELSNEYGAKNLPFMLTTYYDIIQRLQARHLGLQLKVIAPSSQRGDYENFERALAHMQKQNMHMYAISSHYYLRGARKNVPEELSFQDWLTHTKQLMQQYGFGTLPLYIDEYGLNGKSNDEQLKTAYNATWLASRLTDTTYYTNQNITYFISGVYGQPFDSNEGGWLGLFVGYGPLKLTYPVAYELAFENRFKNETVYQVNGFSTRNAGGITDGKGKWILWNLSDTPIKESIEATRQKQLGIIDQSNGNSYSFSRQKKEENTQVIEERSNPFHNPETGEKRALLQPTKGRISLHIPPHGVIFIEDAE